VPGKVCFPYVTGHRQQLPTKKTWLHKDSKKKFRRKRAEKKLYEFWLAVYRGKVQTKGYHIDPAPLGKAEAYAKKAVSLIKGRGLGELEMFCVADEFEEFGMETGRSTNRKSNSCAIRERNTGERAKVGEKR